MTKINKILLVILSLVLVICIAAACKIPECKHEYNDEGLCTKCGQPNPDYTPFVDYVSQLHFDKESDTKKFEVVKVNQYIDGDTTHFVVPSSYEYQFTYGVFKARYLAVDTPESTGTIEDYGGSASRFVKEKLSKAVSIYVEADGSVWDEDATQSRVMAWIWYQPSADAEYINLNLQLLQEGLGRGSNAANNRYGSVCSAALTQAIKLKLMMHSGVPDPEVYRGAAIETTIQDLRLNPDDYNGKKVAVRGVVAMRDGTSAYVEAIDEINEDGIGTGLASGIAVFLSYNPASAVNEAMQQGNYVLLVGTFKLSTEGFPPQITDVQYKVRKPNDPENTRLIEKGQEVSFRETTIQEFFGNTAVTVVKTPATDTEPAVTETVTVATAELMRDASITMKNIVVQSVYTTTQSQSSNGAMTITGTVDGIEITIRTIVLFENGHMVTADAFEGKTIDVKGLVDMYETTRQGQPYKLYQIALFSLSDVTFHEAAN